VGNQQDFWRYGQGVAGSSPSTAAELAKFVDLRDRGVISPEEFAQAKARLLGTPAPSTANSHVDQGVFVG